MGLICNQVPWQNKVAERKKSYQSRNYPSRSIWITCSLSILVRMHWYCHLHDQPSCRKNSELPNPSKYSPNSCPYPILPLFTPRVFGCVVYVHLRKRDRNNVEPQNVKFIIVGFEVTQKGYRYLEPVHNKLYTTIDCELLESPTIFLYLVLKGRLLVMT